ncbi:MAG: ATP-dependent helicase, partial [Candidatus Electrothrix sp. LOE2]|nr:ATP-dependent helicase [Candidatus Electrothrix sp. LOE2]
ARRKQAQDQLSFDDLLTRLEAALQGEAGGRLARSIGRRFPVIMVDEFQDTDPLQYRIFAAVHRAAAAEHASSTADKTPGLFLIGDPKQAIYSFRGADYQNIMEFPDKYPGTDIIMLEQNYRSVRPVLALTNAVIAQAESRYTKQLFSDIPSDELPLLYTVPTEKDEARAVAGKIQHLIADGMPRENIAVLFRSGFHSYNIELELLSRNIDFDKRGGMKFTESAHVKDVLSFFRLLLNAYDNLSLTRILLMLEKVGPKTVGSILSSVLQENDPVLALRQYRSKSKWCRNLHSLADMLIKLRSPGFTVVERFDLIMTWYEAVFERIYYDDYPKRRHDLEYVRTLAAEYYDIRSFIDDTALDPPDSVASDRDKDKKLVLSTIHSAKGLEWDAVFIIGLADGLFPRQNAESEELEEERRLLYVAATRAKKRLFLMHPELIRTPDRKYHHAALSPFLFDVDHSLYEKVSFRRSEKVSGEAVPF